MRPDQEARTPFGDLRDLRHAVDGAVVRLGVQRLSVPVVGRLPDLGTLATLGRAQILPS